MDFCNLVKFENNHTSHTNKIVLKLRRERGCMAGRVQVAALLVAALVCQAASTDLQKQTPFGTVNRPRTTTPYTNHVRKNTALNSTLPTWDKGGFMRNKWLVNKETTSQITHIKPKRLNDLSNLTRFINQNSYNLSKDTSHISKKNRTDNSTRINISNCVSLHSDRRDCNQDISRRNQLGHISEYSLTTKYRKFKRNSINDDKVSNNLKIYDNIISNSPHTKSQRYGPTNLAENKSKFRVNYKIHIKHNDFIRPSSKHVDNILNIINDGQMSYRNRGYRGYGPYEMSKTDMNLRNVDKLSHLFRFQTNNNTYSETILGRIRRNVKQIRNPSESDLETNVTSSYVREANKKNAVTTAKRGVDELFANVIRNMSYHGNTNQMRRDKIDSPMLNYIFDTYSTMNKHTHQNDRFGSPQFEGSAESVVADTSATAYLDCRVASLQDKLVVWVRRKPGENGLHLLTTGLQTYTADTRYSASLMAPDNWRLRITDAAPSDSGLYECQISTHPPMTQTTRLHIHAPVVRIIDGAPKSAKSTLPTISYPEAPTGVPVLSQISTKKWKTTVPFAKTSNLVAPTSTRATFGTARTAESEVAVLADVHYEVNSCLSLSCMVRHVAMEGRVVDWYHEGRHLNYDMDRGGISVRTTVGSWGADSTLSVARVTRADAGNYTCSVATASSTHDTHATVLVHVINGESLAELHQGSAGVAKTSLYATLTSLILSYIIMLCQ